MPCQDQEKTMDFMMGVYLAAGLAVVLSLASLGSVRKLLLQLLAKLARWLLDSIRCARSDRIVPVAMELIRNQVQ